MIDSGLVSLFKHTDITRELFRIKLGLSRDFARESPGAPRSVVWEVGENPTQLIVRSAGNEEDDCRRKVAVKALLSGK